MLGRIMRGVGYSAWFTMALVFFLYLAIPNDRVKTFAESKATAALKTKVRIGGLQLRGLGGVTLTDVKVEVPIPAEAPPPDSGGPGRRAAGGPRDVPPPAPEPPAEKGEAKPESDEVDEVTIKNPPGIVTASEIVLDVNALGLAFGKPLKATMTAEVCGGSITGATFEKSSEGWDLTIDEIDGVNLAPTRLFKFLLKSEIFAMLSGKLDLHWGGSLAQSRGKFELTLGDTVVPHLVFKDPATGFMAAEAFDVAVGQVDFKARLDKRGNLDLGGPAKDGATTLLIDKFQAKGEHLSIELDSSQKHTITFGASGFKDATIDVKLVLAFTDAFYAWKGDGHREDGSEVKDASHEGLRMVLEGPMSPLRNARVRLGKGFFYGYHCRGAVKQLKCTPEAPSRRVSPRFDDGSGAPKPPAGDGNGNGNGNADAPNEALNRPAPPIPARPQIRPPTGAIPPPSPPIGGRPRTRMVEPGRPASDRVQPLANPSVTRRAGHPDPVLPLEGGIEDIPHPEDGEDPTEAPLEPLPEGQDGEEPPVDPPAEPVEGEEAAPAEELPAEE